MKVGPGSCFQKNMIVSGYWYDLNIKILNSSKIEFFLQYLLTKVRIPALIWQLYWLLCRKKKTRCELSVLARNIYIGFHSTSSGYSVTVHVTRPEDWGSTFLHFPFQDILISLYGTKVKYNKSVVVVLLWRGQRKQYVIIKHH